MSLKRLLMSLVLRLRILSLLLPKPRLPGPKLSRHLKQPMVISLMLLWYVHTIQPHFVMPLTYFLHRSLQCNPLSQCKTKTQKKFKIISVYLLVYSPGCWLHGRHRVVVCTITIYPYSRYKHNTKVLLSKRDHLR